MKTHLGEVITPQQSPHQKSTSTLVVLEHNLTRSPVPLLRALLNESPRGKEEGIQALVICLLHDPSVLVANASQNSCLQVLDLTDHISTFGPKSNTTSGTPSTSSELLMAIQEG